jgi:hypothetical protein
MTRAKCFASSCDRQTTAGLCHHHRRDLIARLDSIADWVRDLDIQTTRQNLYTAGHSRRGANPALLFNDAASIVLRHLADTIRRWDAKTADRLGDPVRHPNPIRAARRIRDAIHAGRLDGWAPLATMLDDLDRLHHEIETTIDRPAERWYAGICGNTLDTVVDEHGTINTTICTERLYAEIETGYIDCPSCGATHSVDDQRAVLLTEADDQLLTASDAARAITVLADYERGQNKLVDRIRTWERRGRILARGTIRVAGIERKLYRVGDIQALLREDDAPAKRAIRKHS